MRDRYRVRAHCESKKATGEVENVRHQNEGNGRELWTENPEYDRYLVAIRHCLQPRNTFRG
jgi:hypothetical protein